MVIEQFKRRFDPHEKKTLVFSGDAINGEELMSVVPGANLVCYNFTEAEFDAASLGVFKDDVFRILCKASKEAPAVLKALRDGKVEGSCYVGECCCLIGTIANVQGVDYEELELDGDCAPAEEWFRMIHEGDTPSTSVPASIAAGWIEEWIEATEAA